MSCRNMELEERTGKLRYLPEASGQIHIYMPQEEGYLQICMNLVDSRETNAYGWRLNMMYACDDGLRPRFPITSKGEYEAAIRIVGRPDFMGMGAHGSEQMTDFHILVNGSEVALEDLTALADWERIRICRDSDFYDPLDEVTHVATHRVVYDFDLSGLTVTQEVRWLAEADCGYSYMMMFPVGRDYEGMQITDTYSDDGDPGEYDVSKAGFTGYPDLWLPGVGQMTLSSGKSGITAVMKRLESPELAGGGYRHCWNAPAYNKLYFTVCGGGDQIQRAVPGDRWCTKHRYEVTISKVQEDMTNGT